MSPVIRFCASTWQGTQNLKGKLRTFYSPALCLSRVNFDLLNSRKIDLRLLPILAAIYTFALIDRTNVGAARISGIDEALDLGVGNRVSIASKIKTQMLLPDSTDSMNSPGLLRRLYLL